MSADVASAAALLRSLALAYPETTEDFPWGERVAKVKGKVFVFMGMMEPGDALQFSVKLPASGAAVLARPEARPTGYGLGKHGWVSLSFPTGGPMPLAELPGWVEESFRSVAPRRVVQQWERLRAR
jgi:predicted DNA-binding protein (MmcQ/YjbR family)